MATQWTWANDYMKIVDSLWERGDYEKGKKVLESILNEEPGFAKAHGYRGWYAHYHEKDRALARIHYGFALNFYPALDYTYLHFAELLIEEKDEEGLKKLVEKGAEQPNVDKALLYNDYGRLLEIVGKYSEADRYYKEGVKFTMNYFTMQTINSNRKRVRSKYRLFSTWYSKFL